MQTNILLISDIHLGSNECNSRKLLEFLENCSYNILIILGDLYEEGQLINDEQFKIIGYLRKNRGKIIYIDGNHDPADESLVNEFIGISVKKKYEWSMSGKKFCAIHGHQFDKFCFVFDSILMDKIFLHFMWLLKMINIFGFNAEKWLDSFHNNFANVIVKKAVKYAKRKKIDIIIFGHTHKPTEITFNCKNDKKIEYFNCGGWIGDLCSYITIDENYKIELHLLAPN